MTTAAQIAFGSTLLVVCAIVHVSIIAAAIPQIARLEKWMARTGTGWQVLFLLIVGVVVTLMAHTLQVWSWAIVFLLSDLFETFADAFYFSMTTYTTVGYGDIVLGEGLRIFGTFASVTGWLTFGISTAFLMGLISAIFPSMRGKRD